MFKKEYELFRGKTSFLIFLMLPIFNFKWYFNSYLIHTTGRALSKFIFER